jgi:small subunit ribosomal protein S27Ae
MGKKKRKKKLISKKYKMYQVSGEKISEKNKECPKCGAGTFMAMHKDRLTCGKCSYTEFVKK